MQRYLKIKFLPCNSASKYGSRGFSLLEMMIVVALILIVVAITFMALQPALKDARSNQAFNYILMQLRQARQRAITERKQYIVCFGVAAPAGALTPLGAPTVQSIQMFRWDAGTALSAAAQISANTLPFDMLFQTVVGVPNTLATVPDGFGTAANAIDLDQGVAGGIKDQVLFMPDGSAHDTNGTSNSGIVYVGRSGELYSSRAITLYGATGRIRGWRLIDVLGTPTWMQQ
jgi:prepilin-type N-terminal cleavage/methylation domain-containing protein